MALRVLLLTAAFWSLSHAAHSALAFDAADAKERPVTKVVSLLETMTKQLEEDQKSDEEMKDKFECWCKQNNDDKTTAIAAAQEKISSLNSLVEELGPKIEQLGTEIRTSNVELNKNVATKEKADAIRAQQQAAFKEDEAALKLSIEQASKAIQSLSSNVGDEMKSAYDSPAETAETAPSLLQMSPADLKAMSNGLRQVMDNRGALLYSRLSRADKMAVDDFIRDPAKSVKSTAFLQRAEPSSTSSSIVGILQAMLDDFNEDLQKEETEEKENDEAYTALVAAKAEEKKALEERIVAKTQEKSDAKSTLEESKKDIKATTKSVEADVKFQAAVKSRCTQSDDKFNERMQSRAEELTAVSKTIQVLRSEESRDLFGKTVSFLQQSSHSAKAERAASQASAFLTEQGRKLGVQSLITLGIQSRIDSFTKVKAAIEEMVSALKKQQEDEVKHKDMCVDDLKQNKITTEEKEGAKSKSEDKIEALKTKISQCETQIASLTAEIAEMEKQLQMAGEARQKENVKFQTEADDQRQTQVVLKKAVKFLTDVYAAPASSLVQIRAHRAEEEQPELDSPAGYEDYKQNAGGNGAIALIETIIADSAKLEAEATAAEQDAQTSYEEFAAETRETLKAKNAEVDSKMKEKADAKNDKAEEEANKESTVEELDQLSKTKANLHEECDFFIKNFEVRQTARSQEMEALGQAKGILSGGQK